LIWGINAKINAEINGECYSNADVVIKTFSVTFALSAILLLITFLLKAKSSYKILNIVFAIIYFTVSCAGGCVINEENIKALDYKKNSEFGTIAAEEMNITDEEKLLCSEWFSNNFFGESKKYPFTFKVDGEEFNPAQWEYSLTESPEFGSPNRGGQTEYLVMTNSEKGLELTVETTVFEEQEYTEVWASALVKINTENVLIHNRIEDTFEYLKSLKRNVLVYYHNLKFDGQFWLSFLMTKTKLKNGYYLNGITAESVSFYEKDEMPNNSFIYSISHLGQWYSITIKTGNHYIEFRDSLKLLPFSVKAIGKAFKTKHQKLTMDSRQRPTFFLANRRRWPFFIPL
jgi:hypothetical protein